MNELVPFDYSGSQVRTVLVDDEPWFVASDVCAVLGIRNPRDAARGLDEDEVGTTDVIDALGRTQQVTTISEPGLYALLARSRRPEARPFRRWVNHDVLPAIRRTGSYVSPAAASAPVGRPGYACDDVICLGRAQKHADEDGIHVDTVPLTRALVEDATGLDLSGWVMGEVAPDAA